MKSITYLRYGQRVQLGPWTFAPGWRPRNAPKEAPSYAPYEGEDLQSQNDVRAAQWRKWESFYHKMSSHIPRAVVRPGVKPKRHYVNRGGQMDVDTSEEEYGPESEDEDDNGERASDEESSGEEEGPEDDDIGHSGNGRPHILLRKNRKKNSKLTGCSEESSGEEDGPEDGPEDDDMEHGGSENGRPHILSHEKKKKGN